MKQKITITVEEDALEKVDQLVAQKVFDSRSSVLQAGVAALLKEQALRREKHLNDLYAESLLHLDPATEQAEAEWGMTDYAALINQ